MSDVFIISGTQITDIYVKFKISVHFQGMSKKMNFPLANDAAWIEDKDGNDLARFLECFDYPYVNSQDVDRFSPILPMLFPQAEKEIL